MKENNANNLSIRCRFRISCVGASKLKMSRERLENVTYLYILNTVIVMANSDFLIQFIPI